MKDFITYYKDQTDRSATVSLSIDLKNVTNDAATPVTQTLSATLSGDTAAQGGIDGDTGTAADNETDGNDIDTIAK